MGLVGPQCKDLWEPKVDVEELIRECLQTEIYTCVVIDLDSQLHYLLFLYCLTDWDRYYFYRLDSTFNMIL